MRWEKEIEYWSKHPDGTRVWIKATNIEGAKWWLDEYPIWTLRHHIYVTDDQWTKLRKAAADGKIIQIYNKAANTWEDMSEKWWKTDFYEDYKKFSPVEFRVKPEDEELKKWHKCIPDEGVICWIGRNKTFVRIIEEYYPNTECPFEDNEGNLWKYAKPIKPEECWQGECKGE